MTDNQDRAQPDQFDLNQIEQERDRLQQVRNLYALNIEALKVIGAGNGAGVVAAAAALKSFSNHTVLIKVAGAAFLFGVFCYAIGFFLLYASVTAISRVPGAIRRGKTMEFVNFETNFAAKCNARAIKVAFAGAALFFIGCFLGFIILILV